jgi:hypothetical protein
MRTSATDGRAHGEPGVLARPQPAAEEPDEDAWRSIRSVNVWRLRETL